jgi:peroxiredoxin
MAQLRQDYQSFRDRDVTILVTGPEDRRRFDNYFRDHMLPFTGLPDPTFKVLKLYGQEVNLFKLGRMPAQLLVDKDGLVRFVHYGLVMSDIPDNQQILTVIDELEVKRTSK